jgi:hypothetical protein
MRPATAAVTLAGIVLLTGCSTGPAADGTAVAPAPAPGGSAPATGAPAGAATGPNAQTASSGSQGGDAALAGDTGAICAQAVKTGGDFARTFAGNLKLQIDAASSGDPAAVQRAEQKSARDVQNYSYALNDLSELAADPAVKNALADMSKQVNALKGDVRQLDEEQLAALRTTLDRACGTD